MTVLGSGPQAQQWNLDALGNWTTITSDGTPESRTHNSQNELTGVGATPLAYDANGNMIQDEAGRQLQYNAWNRLVRVSLSGDQVAAYQYNGFQQRIVTTVGNGPSAIARDLFYSAGWQVLEQRIRTGGSLGSVAEEQFVWSVAYIDGLILRDRNADLNNATGAGGLEQRVYALHDALWNTTALVDVNGDVLNRFAYTPYGVVETLNPNWTPTASPSIPWAVLFRGYFADEGTGLLHARNRQYSPMLGRFVGRDPLQYIDGRSLYTAYFVPSAVDPSGLVTYLPYEDWTSEPYYKSIGTQNWTERISLGRKCGPCVECVKSCWDETLVVNKRGDLYLLLRNFEYGITNITLEQYYNVVTGLGPTVAGPAISVVGGAAHAVIGNPAVSGQGVSAAAAAISAGMTASEGVMGGYVALNSAAASATSTGAAIAGGAGVVGVGLTAFVLTTYVVREMHGTKTKLGDSSVMIRREMRNESIVSTNVVKTNMTTERCCY